MPSPTVTITVGGVPVSGVVSTPVDPNEVREGLHMMYLQAVKGEKRRQFVLFPPAMAGFPFADKVQTNPRRSLLLSRVQEFPGNRSKWFQSHVNSGPAFLLDLNNYASRGYVFSDPVVIPLEEDDYLAAWSGNTPHKAMRAIGRALQPYNITIK